MSEDNNKVKAEFVRGLYLYSYRSKVENVLRGLTWLVSWMIGILLVQSNDIYAKSGAYFIFASSMLLEFIPENKANRYARFIHGVFCFCFVLMFLCSTAFIFGKDFFNGRNTMMRIVGVVLSVSEILSVIMIVFSLLLVLSQADKFFYDEEKIISDKKESLREEFRKNLEGPGLNNSDEGKNKK